MPKILGYEGLSPISRIIRWKTDSWCSHVAYEYDDGRVIEAWHKGGVLISESFETRHQPGTVVRAYGFVEPLTAREQAEFEEYLEKHEGHGYDFRNISRFITHIKPKMNDKEFCSELMQLAGWKIGRPFQHKNAAEVTPDHIVISPVLYHHETRRVGSVQT